LCSDTDTANAEQADAALIEIFFEKLEINDVHEAFNCMMFSENKNSTLTMRKNF